MVLYLETGAANSCIAACEQFIDKIALANEGDESIYQQVGLDGFQTARQIGTVYSLFAGDDLRTLLDGFVSQAEAMSALFAVGGGLLEAQDEAVAAALSGAVAEPAGLQSLGLMSSVSVVTEAKCYGAGYGRVGPEDVSGATLEWMASGAQALDPVQFEQVQTQVHKAAQVLRDAGEELYGSLSLVLGGAWQGVFATEALGSAQKLSSSASALASSLEVAAERAGTVARGYGITRSRVGEHSSEFSATVVDTHGGMLRSDPSEYDAARRAAEEQARHVINTEYSPSVMDSNLDDLDFPTAYPVVSAIGVDESGGVDLARVWNTDGVLRPANPGEPGRAAVSAAFGDGAGGERGDMSGIGYGGVVTTEPADVATEQALLTARGGDVPGSGSVGAGGATGNPVLAGAGGPVNASTTAAGAPAPLMNSRGAAATGAGASSRMGGAGTLAGYGAGAGSGLGRVSGPGMVGGAPASSATAGVAGAPGTSASGTGAARMGVAPMGMMGAGMGGNRDAKGTGHHPASYLVNATNTNEILGEPVKVAPSVIGRNPSTNTPKPPEPDDADVSPARALVNKLKGH